MFSKVYLIIGIIIIALYGLVALSGIEFGDTKRQVPLADVRQSGGYRSFHFWYFGYRGGK